MCKTVIWLDLALCCLLLWGAISGYYKGWRESVRSLGGLVCAMLAALPGMTGLKLLCKRYWPVEEMIRAAIDMRLALPVSGGIGEDMPLPGLPWFLQEALHGRLACAAAAGGCFPADLLARALGCTSAFLFGFFLWRGFFGLLGAAPADERAERLKQPSRWGGALICLARQCLSAALLTGLAAPLAWLCGFPPHLLQLEQSLLGRWAWQLFNCLGIWH